ncbi:MAG TPA: amidase [Acidimicrobiales bacterium]|nr:amidase [Acidimicrobiales bacterium]
MATWITPLDTAGTGLRVAVKDAIDVDGVPTTVGCKAVADRAEAATTDAACLAGARAAGARLVGKANLHELCFGTSGINPWFGTPVNPLDPSLVPGGSSSGSAVAVAVDEADVGYGTDTGGSIRIPAACCGIVGLKTTWGRVPLDGVWPLSGTLDTIGPLARTVDDVVAGMALLEPGFSAAPTAARVVGRVRIDGVDPVIDAAVDSALAKAELEVVDVVLEGWDRAQVAFAAIIVTEAWASDREVIEGHPDEVGASVRERVAMASMFSDEMVEEAHRTLQSWRDELAGWFERVEVLALPTLEMFPPTLESPPLLNRLTGPFNLSQTPAISLPVPARGGPAGLPASLQIVGRWDAEDVLCTTAGRVEAAVGRM